MKKFLLGTSAIALAGAIAVPASAAEWEMKISGSMEQQFGFADSDNDNIPGDFDGVDVYSSSEIHFSPSITLDNGIKFGARVELEGEGQTGRSQIDESYLYVTGSFGRLFLGADDNAANSFAYGAPDVTFFNVNSGDDTAYLPFAAAFGTTTTYVKVGGSDPTSIGYFTPRLAGFQVGATYSRDGTQYSNSRTDSDKVLSDIFGVGANYTNTFGDVSIALSGGYTTGSLKSVMTEEVHGLALGPFSGGEDAHFVEFDCDEEDEDFVVIEEATCESSTSGKDPEAWAFGGVIGFGGFSVGGSYSDQNNQNDDMKVYEAGVAYETGPWGVSFNYLRGEKATDDTNIDKFLIGLNYDVATGVRFGAFGAYVESDSDSSSAKSNGDGFVLGTGLVVSF